MNKFMKTFSYLTLLACCIAFGTAEVQKGKILNITEIASPTKPAHSVIPVLEQDATDISVERALYTLVVGGGSWDSEISWEISDGSSGGAGTFELDLADGDYTFTGYDAYGDGWNGGSATMTDADGNEIFSMAVEGSEGSVDFSLASEPPPPAVYGLVVGGGSWDSEISWELSDGSGGAAGTFELELADGDYTFTGYDAFGDGWNGGSASMSDADGNVIFSMAVEGSEGSVDFSVPYSEPPPPPGCEGLTVLMADAYGDGWNGNVLTIGDESFTLESGSAGEGCYTGGMDVTVTCGGGSWESEVSWSINDADGNELLAGGAPFAGCLGDCGGDVYGCMLEGAPNFNPDATVDDGSCEIFIGADYGYWNPGYAGYIIGCGLYYIFPDSDGDGMPDVVGDGSCNDLPPYGGLACEEFGCDGGDCADCAGTCLGDDDGTECWDGSMECDPADCPEECPAENTYAFNMYDAYGDGWNGATFSITDADGNEVASGGLAEGSYGFSTMCLEDGDYTATVGGGSWDSEISWDITDADGSVVAGGAAGTSEFTLGAPPPTIPDPPSDVAAEGYNDPDLGPSLAVTWSPVDGAEYYGIYIWDDTPDEDCSNGEDDDGDGYTDCLDYDCQGTEACPCEGYYNWIGDGYCDSSNNNEDCDWDGGDCCPCTCVDEAYDCETFGGDCDDCAAGEGAGDGANVCPDDCAPPPDCEGLTVNMNDAYGDGWNGNVLTIGDESFTLESGASGEGCYTGGMDVAVTCGGGSWESEVSWSINDADGNELLAGGAPYEGCLGECEEEPPGCEGLTVNMNDAYGDGWNGNVLTIGDESFTLESGASGEGCYTGGMDVAVTCGGGSWESEVSWSINDADGNELLAGGAPFDGCLGDCGDGGGGGGQTLVVGGGSWDSEISWEISDGSSGGAGTFELALADGDYTFTGYDAYGDGWNGGSATLTDADGNEIFSMAVEGSVGSVDFSISSGDVFSGGLFTHEKVENPEIRVRQPLPQHDRLLPGSIEHKMMLKGPNSQTYMNKEHGVGGSVDREGWVNLGYVYHYAPDSEWLTIYGFDYLETATVGVSSVNFVGESDIASAEGTTPDLDAPFNAQVTDEGTLTWEYPGFEPVPYPDCEGVVGWIGDGWCDYTNNNEECGWDGGDCCEGSCDGSADLYSCDECDADGDGEGCGDQSDSDGDGMWDSCCDPAEGGDCAEPEPCTSLDNLLVLPYGDDGCYEETNAFEFIYDINCSAYAIGYGPDPGDLTWLEGYDFAGGFIFYGFGPSETLFFQIATDDGITSPLVEATTSDTECAGEPGSACEEAGGNDGWIGDGWCDDINNIADCDFDAGDCCPCTCVGDLCDTYAGDCDDCSAQGDPAEICPDDCGEEPPPEVCGEGDFTLVVGGGSWDSEISWELSDGSGGAAGTFELALAAGDYTFTGYDAYGDGWNGGSATLTSASGCEAFSMAVEGSSGSVDFSVGSAGDGVSSGNYKYMKPPATTINVGDGLFIELVRSEVKPIVVNENVDRAVTEFNVYDADGYVGTAFDLVYSVDASEGGCWTVTAFDSDLDYESAASNEACVEIDDCTSAGSGDANGDGALNVLDVVIIVGEILEPTWEADSCELATADVNGDGALNVLDVVIIVGWILDGRAADASSATLNQSDSGVTIEADGFVAGIEMFISHGEDFAIELTDDALVANFVTKGNITHLIVVAPESDVIFTSTGDFTIDEVIAANTQGEYITTSINMPVEFALNAAYPNPFNPVTNLNLALVETGLVSMNVYNVSGQLVDVLVDGYLDAGYHNITWNAANVSSGVYFVKVTAGTNISTQKLMLLK